MSNELLIVTLIQFVLFTGYISFLLFKFGSPLKSISESWYQLSPYKQSYLFSVWTGLLGITLLMQGNIPFILSGISLCFVGIANKFKTTEGIQDEIHFGGAFLSITFASFGLYLLGIQWPLLLLLLLLTMIGVSEIRNKIWWLEIGAFGLIWGGFMERAIIG